MEQAQIADYRCERGAYIMETLFNSYFGGGMNAVVFQEMRESDWSSDVCSSDLMTLQGNDVPREFILSQR